MRDTTTLEEEIAKYKAMIEDIDQQIIDTKNDCAKQIHDLKRQQKVDQDILKSMEKGLNSLKEQE